MKFHWKPYKSHAHDKFYGDFTVFGAKFLIFSIELMMCWAMILSIGYAIQKLLF